jgi:hypothetical protein
MEGRHVLDIVISPASLITSLRKSISNSLLASVAKSFLKPKIGQRVDIRCVDFVRLLCRFDFRFPGLCRFDFCLLFHLHENLLCKLRGKDKSFF